MVGGRDISALAIADLDDGLDSLAGYRSALHGREPELAGASCQAEEVENLALALEEWHDDGVAWTDMAVVARTRWIAQRVARELDRLGSRRPS